MSLQLMLYSSILALIIAVVVVTVNFLVDMAYAVLDPRIKYED